MKSSGPSYIGVDLGGTNVRAGLVRGARVLKVQAQTVRAGSTNPKDVFDDLCGVIDGVFVRGVRAIGVGVPSLVDHKTGTVINTSNIPTWTDVPLRKKLEKKYGVPVRLDNDANCFALGERFFGCGRKYENFVGLIIGTGMGAGLIVNGDLHSGVDGGAGEFGMIPYRDSILEHYASGQFFARQKRDGEALAKAAAAGDAEALEIFRQYGKHVAHGIKIILYGMAPQMIVLGGSVSQSYAYFRSTVEEELKDFVYPTVVKKLRIEISKLKGAAILGAASLVLKVPGTFCDAQGVTRFKTRSE